MEKKTIYDWLSHRLWLIIRDAETLAPRFSIRLTGASVLVGLAGLLVLCFFAGLMFYQLIGYFQSRTQNENDIKRQIVSLAMSIDSLSEALEARDRYINDLKLVMLGETPYNNVRKDSGNANAVKVNPEEVAKINPLDSSFRNEFEMEASATRPVRNAANAQLKSFVFFTPLKGVLLGKFEPQQQHYGVDIVARKNEPIKAVADGTVIISSWTQDSGYTIGIQHKNQLISFYKHNSVLLRKTGETVRAGDIIAIIGNSGELTDGPHLHFELWYNGSPVNPEQYISF
ncbi:M23 family metallopeptidase [Rhodoflexus caldus]|uniref:M23 family metallopeptidase n=1 Tax=Rhodoflexus caldus TaxID=2891236 RepID=UPI00202A66E1|nr:M23 family metallopeptidase [Rhodoflexus caldus]